MTTIPQRDLRNKVSEVLRRAEEGERFTITVGGRPVAELGPLAGGRAPAPPSRLEAILTEAPVDPSWPDELRRMREAEAAAADPWSE